jgi:hypothetical protein
MARYGAWGLAQIAKANAFGYLEFGLPDLP